MENMNVFENYAYYYNLLYQDKDYLKESDYLSFLIKKFKAGCKTVLDLGCGTGEHDFNLATKNFSVTGVDQSETMLSVARQKLANLDPSLAQSLSFHHHDIRDLRLGKTYDSVFSLFHVLSYQQTNDDLMQVMATVSEHLKPGGIFIFDCWYGPGVLEDPPSVQVKKAENDSIAVTRVARPLLHRHHNRVDIHYHVTVRKKDSSQFQVIRECHRMRYLFKPELEGLLGHFGLEVIHFTEFMKDEPPGPGRWNALFVSRKV